MIDAKKTNLLPNLMVVVEAMVVVIGVVAFIAIVEPSISSEIVEQINSMHRL